MISLQTDRIRSMISLQTGCIFSMNVSLQSDRICSINVSLQMGHVTYTARFQTDVYATYTLCLQSLYGPFAN